MQLIAQLNEAADIPLEDLRAAVKKDKRVNKIFTKNLQLDEIDDVKEFIQTLRFYVLNNRHVIEHVKRRNGASKNVNDWSLRSLRQTKPEALTQAILADLQQEVQDLLRDITSTQNTSYSNDTGQSLWGWINGMRGYLGPLDTRAIRELKSYPALRPAKPIMVFRGLLFDERSLKEVTDYNGGMNVGAGLKFLRSIREGKRIANVEYDQATKWHRSREAALDEAHNGDETWRSERKQIRGELAFVVSMLVDPSKIIVDTAMIPKVTHEKPVVIVDSGKYTVRIVHKFTPQGEVDPLAAATAASEGASVLENLQTFAHVFKLPFPEPSGTELTRGGAWDDKRLEELKTLSDPSARAKIIKSMQVLIDYYNQYLKDTPKNELNDLISHSTLGPAAQVAIAIGDMMVEKAPHPTKRDERYSTVKPLHLPLHELSAEEMWEGDRYSTIRGSIPTLKMSESTPRFRDWSTFSPIISLMHLGKVPIVKDLHQKGAKVQRAEILKAIDGFFNATGIPQPAGQAEAVDKIHEIVRTYERNARVLEKLSRVRQLLDRLKD